jgi:8-oxo-dGTP diphosphatase
MKDGKDRTRPPILAAGGIVLRPDGKPEIALVQLRKMGAWVLPKGKLAGGESAIAAARREVIEETGHRVSMHEFLGTLAYETGGRQKVVQFWRMQALGGPVGELMRDVKAMEWLTLADAIARLTHAREQVFLGEVGPLAIRLAARRARRSLVRRVRPASAPRPDAPVLPELVAPVDFVAPLPPDNLVRIAGPWREGRVIELPAAGQSRAEQAAIEKNLLERARDWLRGSAAAGSKSRRE